MGPGVKQNKPSKSIHAEPLREGHVSCDLGSCERFAGTLKLAFFKPATFSLTAAMTTSTACRTGRKHRWEAGIQGSRPFLRKISHTQTHTEKQFQHGHCHHYFSAYMSVRTRMDAFQPLQGEVSDTPACVSGPAILCSPPVLHPSTRTHPKHTA